ncbi:MAG: hypothetical protein VKQ33_12575 [Candidatus Sericytochromatia bacterium]|nr:hypothetical protein [Candidatus Sericytochromatia bacterium]
MFGRYSTLAAVTAVLMASPALAMTQDAPTTFLGQNTAAVLSKGVSYFSAGTGMAPGINYATSLAGGEFGLGVNGAATLGGLGRGIGLAASYKYPLAAFGAVQAAIAANAAVGGLGGAFALGAGGVSVPLTMDLGQALISVAPGVAIPSLGAPGTGLTFGANVGAQLPVADKLSGLVTVPVSTAGLGAFTLGLRMSPTSTSHVDFNIGGVTTSPFGITAGTVGVTGHIGWR